MVAQIDTSGGPSLLGAAKRMGAGIIAVPWQSWRRQNVKIAVFDSPLSHWLMLFALVVMWGSSFGLTKIAVSAMPAEAVVAARLLIAGGFLVALLIFTGRRLPLDWRLWALFFTMALVGNCLPYWLITWGQTEVDSGLAGILMAVMPIVTLVLAHFFVNGERLTWAKGFGFVLGFAGVVVLMGPGNILNIGSGGSSLLAQMAIVGGAICYAVNTIIARFCPLRDSLVIATGTACAANIFVLPFTFGELPASVGALDVRSLMALATLGVVSTALAPLVYFKLIRLAGPSFLSTMNYLIPLWAVLIGMIFLGETPAWSALAALALILSGIGLSQFKPRTGKSAPRRSIPTDQILSPGTKLSLGKRRTTHPTHHKSRIECDVTH